MFSIPNTSSSCISNFSYLTPKPPRSFSLFLMSSTGSLRQVERGILRLLHGRSTCTHHLAEIHARILRYNLHQSNLILSHFVSVCASLCKMPYAHLIFLQTQNPNILLFNSMIKGYSLSGPPQESLRLFTTMKNHSIWPDQFTFPPLLKSCSNLSDIDVGRGIHAEVLTAGFEAHNSVQIGLVELYASCDSMDDAQRVFCEMSQRDVVVWNMMVRGFCKKGDIDAGFYLFRQMSERSVVSWNSMISGLAQGGRDSEALGLFHEMWDAGFEPDDATVVTILPVCAHLGALDVGKRIHSYADGRGLSKDIIAVGNALVDMYCKCGDLVSARMCFDEMPRRNVVSWNSIISGLAMNGHGNNGIGMFEEMKRQGIEPNDVTFIAVIGCCTHTGLVQRGRELFDLMIEEHHIKQRPEHYGCMVDLLGRYGHVKEAFELIKSMPMRPSAAIWGALLSACRIHGDLETAERAAKELVNLEPWNSGNYVLLSNIYAEAGRWDDVENVRVSMRDKCVWKAPGQSMLESCDYGIR